MLVSHVKIFANDHAIEFPTTFKGRAFRRLVFNALKSNFERRWHENLVNTESFPLLRTYKIFKKKFCFEKYLSVVVNRNHRIALSRYRCSSHHLPIETGRWQKPKIPEKQRLCISCRAVGDELHFLSHCRINRRERAVLNSQLFNLLKENYQTFRNNLFPNILSSQNDDIISLLAKFLYDSFKRLDEL